MGKQRRKQPPPRPSYDPSRTMLLQQQLSRILAKKFKELSSRIISLIDKEDVFGLRRKKSLPSFEEQMAKERKRLVRNQRWQFRNDPDKVRAFQEWLRIQLKDILLSSDDEEVWRKFAEISWQRGFARSVNEVSPVEEYISQQTDEKIDFYAGSRQEFLRSSFQQPVNIEAIQLLAGRAFTDLQGVTEAMSAQMTRVLVDGLAQGKGARELARELANVVDGMGRRRAETIARTELVRAHSEAQLTGLEKMGVEEVGVAVEYSTTKDGRVCSLCAPLEGIVLKIKEARGMIPLHPNCRCAFLPANTGEDTTDQIDTKKEIDKALRESKENRPKGDDWEPPKISKDRPESLLDNLLYLVSQKGNHETLLEK